MLVLKTILDLTSNDTCEFNDITGQLLPNSYNQNGNIDYSQVSAIRLKIGNYTTVNANANPPSGNFIQYTEYLKVGGGAETINNKTFYAGDYFVPQFDNLQTAYPTDWETTGYYVYPYLNTWLPTATEVPLGITISQLGQTGDDIEDNEYIYEYEVYYNSTFVTTPAIEGTSYIVVSAADLALYVEYNGNRYYGGETFTAIDNTDITSVGGTVFAELYAATTSYSTMVYALEKLLNQGIWEQIGKGSQDLVNIQYGELYKIKSELEALSYSSKTQNVSLLYAYNTINLLTSRLSQIN